MERITAEQASIDALAEQAGGYFSIPSKDSMEYTELLFDIYRQLVSAIIRHPPRSVGLLRK